MNQPHTNCKTLTALPPAPMFVQHAAALKDAPQKPVVPPRLFNRQDFMNRFPTVQTMLDTVGQHGVAPGAPVCLITPLHLFIPLFYPEPPAPSPEEVVGCVPVLCLPAELESHLPALVTSAGRSTTRESLDLCTRQHYVCWSSTVRADDTTHELEVLMNEHAFMSIFFRSTWSHQTPWPGVWQPVIMLAGDTAAVGGLWLDNEFQCFMQCASMHAEGYLPGEWYAPKELLAARKQARQYGNEPWRSGVWTEPGYGCDWLHCIEPTVLDDVKGVSTSEACQRSVLQALQLTDCPAVMRMRSALIEHLTRVWPTQQHALTPPAMASLTPVDGLELQVPVSIAGTAARALTLFLPDDFEAHLPALGRQIPRVRVQPDLSLRAQCAYVSLETGQGRPPLTAWLEARAVLAALDENQAASGQAVLPLLLVAGQTVIVTEFAPDESWLTQARAALEAARQPPVGVTAQKLAKAQQKAERYSERPWLFRRYALQNGEERLGVNCAPVQRMHPAAH